MNFFEQQDRAKAASRRLILLFVAAVFGVALCFNLIFHYSLGFYNYDLAPLEKWIFHGMVSGAVLLTILLGSWYKWHQLTTQGGISIALDLGATSIHPDTENFQQRQLLNVVEEMAIASGIVMPEVFVLEENGINALAAGFRPNDAVIAVSRGALETLNRGELQGVVAHEFSHIFHGDMRLNMRMMGILHGLKLISSLGRALLMGRRRGMTHACRSSKRRGTHPALMALGFAMLVLGAIGVFFGRLVQAAFSRQREFLADASAVQYTRNPDGIAGALKKIGGWSNSSEIQHPGAEEISHFFMAEAVSKGLSGWLATHPPLEKRIQAIDPHFQGSFEKTQKLEIEDFESGLTTRLSTKNLKLNRNLQDAIKRIGDPRATHLAFAQELLSSLPIFVRHACHDLSLSRAVVASSFLQQNKGLTLTQKQAFYDLQLGDIYEFSVKIFQELSQRSPYLRLALLELCMPIVKQLPSVEKSRLLELIKTLIHADDKIELLEFALFKIVQHNLQERTSRTKKKPKKSEVIQHLKNYFSVIIYETQRLDNQPTYFQQALQAFGLKAQIEKSPPLTSFQEALQCFEGLSLKFKEQLLLETLRVFEADKSASPEEAELLRAVAISLDIPTPPLLVPPDIS